ncbi:MAG TPA: DUF3891 family protein [Tepidisphaeraceae bacterium]|jgi:hypothetical protein|nr:DUF3891 family protein [Tepidisphaeraceae bacterium]
MIRREVGDEYWLITQNDHAILSGQLAEQFGAGGAQALAPAVIAGIAMHDAGWPLHDEAPTLNNDHIPIDVFESRREVALKVWSASAKRAAIVDPYAGLLVSLHSLALSVFAATQTSFKHEKVDMSDPRTRFDMNKFQHGQIELQEKLRAQLGMRTDLPIRNGLSEESDDLRERQLIFDFRLLQALDKLSLAICCTKPPFPKIEPLLRNPGEAPIALSVTRPSSDRLLVKPWLFRVREIALRVSYKAIPARRYESEVDFRRQYGEAPVQSFNCTATTG